MHSRRTYSKMLKCTICLWILWNDTFTNSTVGYKLYYSNNNSNGNKRVLGEKEK